MKIRLPLYAQIFGMLFLYLSSLAVLIFISFNAQFGFGWDALIKSPLGDRVNTVADSIVGQLNASSPDRWNEVLKSFEGRHHIRFYIFDIFGHQLAGEHIALPPALVARLPEFPLPPPPPDGWGAGGPGHFADHGPMELGEKRPGVPGPMPPEWGERGPGGILGPGPGDRFGQGSDDGPGGRPRISRLQLFAPHHFDIPWALMHAHGQFMVHTQNPDRFWICSRIHFPSTDHSHPVPSVIVGASDNIWQSNLLFDSAVVLEFAAVLLFVSLAIWWPFIHSISSSLSKLALATERIAEGRFDTRVETNRGDEIGRLSDAVNSMAERLTNFVHGQKRFLGDISHELFSPIARLQMALELLDEESSEAQTRSIQDIREEIQEMTSLVNELLAFSKAGLQGKDLELVVVHPKSAVLDLITRMNLTEIVSLNISDNVEVVADPLMLSRAFSNILRNSVRYAGEKGPIDVGAEKHGKLISITFADRGPGVPEEALKRLAEPFYRPEASRSRSSGGVGLGLAIVKSCVEACNGTMLLRNRAGGGLEVEVRLAQP